MKAKLIIEMPKTCTDCEISYREANDWEDLMCPYTNSAVDEKADRRPDSCPLEPVEE